MHQRHVGDPDHPRLSRPEGGYTGKTEREPLVGGMLEVCFSLLFRLLPETGSVRFRFTGSVVRWGLGPSA